MKDKDDSFVMNTLLSLFLMVAFMMIILFILVATSSPASAQMKPKQKVAGITIVATGSFLVLGDYFANMECPEGYADTKWLRNYNANPGSGYPVDCHHNVPKEPHFTEQAAIGAGLIVTGAILVKRSKVKRYRRFTHSVFPVVNHKGIPDGIGFSLRIRK